jgi:hypothetical protein
LQPEIKKNNRKFDDQIFFPERQNKKTVIFFHLKKGNIQSEITILYQ